MQERALKTQECILAAAAQLLVNRGAKSTTTNNIAELSGYSIGALYQHFPNKEAIFERLMDDVLQAPVAAIEEFEPSGSLAESLERLIVAAAGRLAGQDPALWRVLETMPGGEFARKRIDTRERAIFHLQRVLQSYRDEIVPQDLALTARLLIAAVEGFALAADRTLFESRAFYDDCHRLLLAYLKYRDTDRELTQ